MEIKMTLKEWYGINDLAIPTEWEDTSWHNDAMYSFELGHVRVWIDTVDRAKSEFGYDLEKSDYNRFNISVSDKYREENPDDHYNDSWLLSTNDWSEILEYVSWNNE
jgi:hypothetical protein